MKFKLLQFSKSHQTIDQFSDILQKTMNEANDLVSLESFESVSGNVVYVALAFSNQKIKQFEVMAFFGNKLSELEEQINGTITMAYTQGKKINKVSVIPFASSPRAIGFLVLEKTKEAPDAYSDQAEKAEAQKTGKQNSKANARANSRAKN